MMLSRRIAFYVAGSLGAVLLATGAQAQFLMSGTLTESTGNFVARRITAGAVPVAGAAGSLMIPAQAFALSNMAFRTFPTSASIAQVASTFTSSNAAATFSAGGGPGAFSWCPQGNIPCSDPDANATGGFHGLLVYSDGGGYGGTFEIMRNSLGTLARRVAVGSYSHSDSANVSPWGGGRAFSAMHTSGSLNGPILTTSFGANGALGPNGSIQTIGTTLGQPGDTPGFPVGAINQIGSQPASPSRFVTGFPATTGMIKAMDNTGAQAPDTFTWTGSDGRNANGHGNITLVASGYSNNLSGEVFPHRLVIEMSIGPPVPTMGAPGIAALGILVLVGAGYAMRRRL